MDSRNLIRFLFLFFITAVVLLLTRINIPFSDKPENLTENRFLQSNLKQPSKPTTTAAAHRHASVVPHHPPPRLRRTPPPTRPPHRYRTPRPPFQPPLPHALPKLQGFYAIHSAVNDLLLSKQSYLSTDNEVRDGDGVTTVMATSEVGDGDGVTTVMATSEVGDGDGVPTVRFIGE
ncbi:hypothetical protein L6452_31504 [Arctium lappa]|uniref:Uncharacterized protein n=2 Tax=Arctium lappa TaxID=4217 RepID=A0ACB8Z175_ARCLA|nr:hypothetical protein L6452_31500 [Arctium lappa]KAI3691702.1 hypothetical protein L6452_31504 [Arctium lappa]